jgi:hypothetical protein
MTVRLAIKILFVAPLVTLAAGCAAQHPSATLTVLPDDGHAQAPCSRAGQTIKNLFPPQYRSTQRAIVTAGGRQFTCDGLLEVSPTEGHHLALVCSLGVVTDLRVKADGGCEVLKVTPLFREDWSRRFVARDLRWLFIPPPNLQPAGLLADNSIVLETAADSAGVTAAYIFSPDGARWQALDLIQNGTIFYHAVPKNFRKFPGTSDEIPGGFEVSAQSYRLDLRIAELAAPKTEGQP